MRLVHLTDPHLSSLDSEGFWRLRGKRRSGYLSWRKNRSKRYLPEVLNRLTDAVRAERADRILVTGDLLQIGLENEVAQATQWLTRLGSAEQVVLIPGNHDVYAKGSADSLSRAWSDYLFPAGCPDGANLESCFPVVRKLGSISLIGLSTACVTPIFMASGSLGSGQLHKLSNLLKQAASEGQLVCLLIHHPPLPGMTNFRKALADANALESVMQPYPPALIFHGHLHHNREQLWGESHIYCTASSSSISDASFRVVDIEDKGEFWALRQELKSIVVNEGGELDFATVDEQSWQTYKATG